MPNLNIAPPKRRQVEAELHKQLWAVGILEQADSYAHERGFNAMTTPWVRSHAPEIPGFKRLGSYFRFCRFDLEHWLGSLDRLFEAGRVSALLGVPESWVYANADEIPGVLRLGRYVRFRPTVIQQFLAGSQVVM